MRKSLLYEIQQATLAIESLQEPAALDFLEALVQQMVEGYRAGKKVLIAGNGGSLCDAIHFAEEMTGFYRLDRPALAAIALADPGHVTCVANDRGYDSVFSRGVEAHGKPGDLFMALSTSGNSTNLLRALQEAKQRELKTVAFLGKKGGAMQGLAHLEWIVPHVTTADHIQEAHMAALHLVIHQVEQALFVSQELELQQVH